jgi:GNAT superfamily N-acetyltransferase
MRGKVMDFAAAQAILRTEVESMTVPSITSLEPTSPFIAEIARRQFDHWGPLTGYPSQIGYRTFLEQAARNATLPRVLVAATPKTLLGSVNLLVGEMTIRPHLTPWLAQLFVTESARGTGIGAALADAAARYVEKLGYQHLFLFTSGTLPSSRLGGYRGSGLPGKGPHGDATRVGFTLRGPARRYQR